MSVCFFFQGLLRFALALILQGLGTYSAALSPFAFFFLVAAPKTRPLAALQKKTISIYGRTNDTYLDLMVTTLW